MPYYSKRKNNGKVYYKKRHNVFYHRGVNKAMKLAKFAISRLNAESNINDVNSDSTNLAAAGNFQQLSLLSQGDSNTTRDGNQVKWTSIYYQGLYTSVAGRSDAYRTMILLDKQPNGATISAALILEDTGSPITSALEKDGGLRFKVLWDKRFVMNSRDSTTDIAQKKYIKKYIKLPEGLISKTRYSGNVGDITDLASNCFYVVHFSDRSTATFSTVAFNVRCRFIDN